MGLQTSNPALRVLDLARRIWSNTPIWAILASIVALPISLFYIDRYRGRYERWRALGPGGLPYNIKGYLLNVVIGLLYARSETKSLGVYDQPEISVSDWQETSEQEKRNARSSFLKDALPKRQGHKAKALNRFVIPQRQLFAGEFQNPKVKEAYLAAFEKLIEDNRDILEVKTSLLERRGQALFLKPTIQVPAPVSKSQSEICHIHSSDLSAHVTLSLADAREVITKGWGERHRLSGTKILHIQYTMLYVPRTVQEAQVLIQVFQAGIDYMRSEQK